MNISLTLTSHEICPEKSSEGQKNRGYECSFVGFREFLSFSFTEKIVLQNVLMNWQKKGVNSNYRSAKFEEILSKKTGDISCERLLRLPFEHA